VKRPKVFLLDEPLSNLDAQLRAQTRLEIAALHRRIGSTTIYVTHDQEEAMTLADRIVVLKAGKLQQVGAPLELYNEPINRFVGSFIGSPRMNFIEGKLELSYLNSTFTIGAQRMDIPRSRCPSQSGQYILGFRPEAFEWNDRRVLLELEWIEHHGFDVHLIAKLGGQRITLRSPERELPRKLEVGSRFSIEIDPDQLHWFSTAGDQKRIEVPQRRSAA
jgi:ABC-type sugar transport system ATPase subunit